MRWCWRWCWFVTSLPWLLGGCVTVPHLDPQLRKCVWVNRWEYHTALDINHIMRRCADAGFSTVMFQIRANATALYSSRQEVWAEQFDFKAPTFDPLSQAVASAHANGLKIQAWVNMLPGWCGDKPPADKRQLFCTRPEWFLRTGEGSKGLVKEGSYYWLNPCLPEVRAYLATICREIADDYEVDGIHLDYIRFPGGAPADAPADTMSRSLFHKERGVDPDKNPQAFARWKQECVTQLVQDVRHELSRLYRPVELSVAVIADLHRATTKLHQNWPVWAARGTIDAVFPMAYADDNERFRGYVGECVSAARAVPVIAGVGAYRHQTPDQTVGQMDAAIALGARGVAIYGYSKFKERDWTTAVTMWHPRK
jgi:uncharacterized lipoprotein YddW (UPF0748 family)